MLSLHLAGSQQGISWTIKTIPQVFSFKRFPGFISTLPTYHTSKLFQNCLVNKGLKPLLAGLSLLLSVLVGGIQRTEGGPGFLTVPIWSTPGFQVELANKVWLLLGNIYIFAYCGLVVEIQPQKLPQFKLLLSFQRQPRKYGTESENLSSGHLIELCDCPRPSLGPLVTVGGNSFGISLHCKAQNHHGPDMFFVVDD